MINLFPEVPLGMALYKLERYQEALAAYEQATAMNPSFAAAWHNKGLLLRALGRNAEAEAAERQFSELGG